MRMIWQRNCPKCNRVLLYTTKGNLTRAVKSNCLCKKCLKTWNINQFVSVAQTVHGLKYDYSVVNYINARTKVKILCPNHGVFSQLPDAHINQKQGCPKCKHDLLDDINTLTTPDFIKKSELVHGKIYDYSISDYVRSQDPITIICRKHGKFNQRSSDHLQGHGCPHCISIISKMEREFLDVMHVPDTNENRQVLINRKKVDGLVGNTVYEFLGDYWHGNPNKFIATDVNDICHKTYGELYHQTLQRFEKLNKLGYIVNYIWEADWKMWKKGKFPLLFIQKYKEKII